MRIGFIFSLAPFGNAIGREGLDAVLAASNYCEDLALFFVGDGVMQLLSNQDPSPLHCRDHVKTFKLLSICDVENIYLCQESLNERGLTAKPLLIDAKCLPAKEMAKKLAQCKKILRF